MLMCVVVTLLNEGAYLTHINLPLGSLFIKVLL